MIEDIKSFMKDIEMLNKKIEAQDKIINEQALEIARLKSNYNFVKMQFSKMTKEDVLKALTSKCEECERLFNSYDRVTAKYQNVKYRIDKAIEYIKDNIYKNGNEECYSFDGDIFEVLEILGDKENENIN